MDPLLGYLGALTVGLGLTLATVGVASARRRPAALQRLADQRPLDEHQALLAHSLPRRLTELARKRLEALTARWPGSRARTAALRRKLDYAGLSWPTETVAALRLVATAGGLLAAGGLAMVADLPLWRGVAGAVICAVAGALAPSLWLARRGSARERAIDRALPEALDLLALAVEAGLGLEQALDEVSGELSGPLREELDRTLREEQLGRSRAAALSALAARTPSEDLRGLVSALLQTDRLGVPVGTTLQVHARELRRRRRARAREEANKAPVKLLLPLIVGILPGLFVVILGPAVLSIIEAFSRT